MAETRAMILSMCGLKEEALDNMRFEAAYEYLRVVLGVDAYGIDELPKHGMFWSWWFMQWHKRDLIFLDRLRFEPTLGKYTCRRPHEHGERVNNFQYVLHCPAHFRYFYGLYHCISKGNIYINSAVMEAGYHNLIKGLAKGKEAANE